MERVGRGWLRSVKASVAGTTALTGLVLVDRWAVLLMAVIAILVIVGVVYPAIWSRKSTRKRAALRVLRVLLSDRRRRAPGRRD